MIDPAHKCPVQRQCASVGLSRSAYYYRSRGPSLECRRMLAAAVALHREQPSAPNRVWASDLTQLQVSSGLMHAAVIIDLNARLVVGCRLSNTADTELCLNALADACRVYGCPAIFHSDKGSQFTSRSFRSELHRRGIKPSMTGRRGWKGNVFVERFIWCLKNDCSRLREWYNGSQARRGTTDFIRYYTTASIVTASCRVALPPRRMACQLKLLARSLHLLVASSELSLVPYSITLLSKLKAPSHCAYKPHSKFGLGATN